MIGMKVNETRDLNLTFPENYQAEDLAGQDVVFKVTVKKLSVKKEAELNDDFVEGLGVPEIKTVEDLKLILMKVYNNNMINNMKHKKKIQFLMLSWQIVKLN